MNHWTNVPLFCITLPFIATTWLPPFLQNCCLSSILQGDAAVLQEGGQPCCCPSCRTAAFQVFSKETPLFESQDLDIIAEHDSLWGSTKLFMLLVKSLMSGLWSCVWYSVCHLCSMCLMSMLLRISFYLKCVKHNCYQNIYLCYMFTNSMLFSSPVCELVNLFASNVWLICIIILFQYSSFMHNIYFLILYTLGSSFIHFPC